MSGQLQMTVVILAPAGTDYRHNSTAPTPRRGAHWSQTILLSTTENYFLVSVNRRNVICAITSMRVPG